MQDDTATQALQAELDALQAEQVVADEAYAAAKATRAARVRALRRALKALAPKVER